MSEYRAKTELYNAFISFSLSKSSWYCPKSSFTDAGGKEYLQREKLKQEVEFQKTTSYSVNLHRFYHSISCREYVRTLEDPPENWFILAHSPSASSAPLGNRMKLFTPYDGSNFESHKIRRENKQGGKITLLDCNCTPDWIEEW